MAKHVGDNTQFWQIVLIAHEERDFAQVLRMWYLAYHLISFSPAPTSPWYFLVFTQIRERVSILLCSRLRSCEEHLALIAAAVRSHVQHCVDRTLEHSSSLIRKADRRRAHKHMGKHERKHMGTFKFALADAPTYAVANIKMRFVL